MKFKAQPTEVRDLGLRRRVNEERMKTASKQEGKVTNEAQFELKYCERCGGLWLRPVGGEQVYCVVCSRQMADLPPASHEVGRATRQKGPRWGADHREYEDSDAGGELEPDTVGLRHE